MCVILYVWKSKICLDIGRALALSTIDQCQWRFLDMFDNSSCYLPLRWNLSCSILSDTSCVLHLLFFGSQYPRDWIISLVKIKSCCIWKLETSNHEWSLIYKNRVYFFEFTQTLDFSYVDLTKYKCCLGLLCIVRYLHLIQLHVWTPEFSRIFHCLSAQLQL